MAQTTFSPSNAVLSTSAVAIHTVGGTVEQNVDMEICNITVNDTTVSLWIVPAGDTRADKHLWLKDYIMYAREPRMPLNKVVLAPGTTIWAGAGADSTIALHVLGVSRPIA